VARARPVAPSEGETVSGPPPRRPRQEVAARIRFLQPQTGAFPRGERRTGTPGTDRAVTLSTSSRNHVQLPHGHGLVLGPVPATHHDGAPAAFRHLLALRCSRLAVSRRLPLPDHVVQKRVAVGQ